LKRFTLIEFLIVIAVLVILMSLLQPSISSALSSAKTAKCLGQERSLMVAVSFFSEDEEGRFPGANDRVSLNPDNWIDDYSWASNRKTVEPIKRGSLYKYTQNTDLYKCPEDNRHNVSFQMSNLIGARSNIKNGHQVETIHDLKSPQHKMVFVEEDSWREIAIGAWAIHASTSNPNLNLGRWWDDVANWHSNGMNVAFADGHAEYWKWEDPRTISPEQVSPNKLGTTWHLTHPNSPDIDRTRRAYLGLTPLK